MIFFKENPHEITEHVGYDLHNLYIDRKQISEKDRLFYIEIPLKSYNFV